MGIHDTDPNTPNKEFAPDGWHVPSDAEWTTLEEYLIANGYNYDGTTTENKIAKSMASSTGWVTVITFIGTPGDDNQSLNNSSSFNAFPVGYRGNLNSDFRNEHINAIFWSSTEDNTNRVWTHSLVSTGFSLNRSDNLNYQGFSVRLIKD